MQQRASRGGIQRADRRVVRDHIDGLLRAALVVVLLGAGNHGVLAELVHRRNLLDCVAVVIVIGDFVLCRGQSRAGLIDQVDILVVLLDRDALAGVEIGRIDDRALDLAALNV